MGDQQIPINLSVMNDEASNMLETEKLLAYR